MSNYLQPQLKNAVQIKKILKEVSTTFRLADGRSVKTLLVYLPIQNGQSTHIEFFEKIKDGILTNFVFSCSEVEKKLGIAHDAEAPELLFSKAIRKLSHKTAHGELGELILFTLLDVYYQCPKLLSKIALKTNPRMPVYGADAVHGQFENGQFYLYLGEAKLHANFKSASTQAASSIKSAKEKYDDEFDLLDSFIDFPNLDEALKQELLKLLNPFSTPSISEKLRSPCFIGFTQPELISEARSETEFIEHYKELASDYIENFFSKIEQQGLTVQEASLLMLPFTCIDHLVGDFISYIGIDK